MELSYQAQKHLRGITPEVEAADTKEKLAPKTREERERVPAEMAANLMDYYMETINDDTMLNPIRDGIPQCRNHPFDPGNGWKIGCIHSCAKKNPELALPVVRDYTLGDVYTWVRSLVAYSVNSQESRMGYRRPTDLTR